MRRTLSLYLDVVRFMAAVVVVISHLRLLGLTKGIISDYFAPYANMAVTIFFVLSGYVISYVTESRESSASSYFISRASRLYSVVIPALIFTVIADYVGSRINPDFYAGVPETIRGYVTSAFFINEFQSLNLGGVAPGSNGPYWSMSFEATYYIVAGLFLFFRRWWSLAACALILGLAGRTIVAMFPLWIIGFLLFRSDLRLSPKTAVLVVFASLIAIVVSPRVNHAASPDQLGWWLPYGPNQGNRGIVFDYVAGIAFAVHLVAFRSLPDVPWLLKPCVERAIRWLGSLTFPLYLFHLPAACFLAVVSPWPNTSRIHLAFILCMTFVVILAAAPACERFRISLRRVLSYRSKIGGVSCENA